MYPISEKIFLQLSAPTEDDPVSDQGRILSALQKIGYKNVTFPLSVLRKLYPLCRTSGFTVTVTVVYQQTHWVVVDVESGDRRQHHYGLAVDYGSTTIVMRLVDLNSGSVVGEEKAVNVYSLIYESLVD